jgi:hypothetical protein
METVDAAARVKARGPPAGRCGAAWGNAPFRSRRPRPARASLSSLSLSRTQSVHGPNSGVNAPPESFITDAQNASIANCSKSGRRDFLRTLVMLDLAVEQVCVAVEQVAVVVLVAAGR